MSFLASLSIYSYFFLNGEAFLAAKMFSFKISLLKVIVVCCIQSALMCLHHPHLLIYVGWFKVWWNFFSVGVFTFIIKKNYRGPIFIYTFNSYWVHIVTRSCTQFKIKDTSSVILLSHSRYDHILRLMNGSSLCLGGQIRKPTSYSVVIE